MLFGEGIHICMYIWMDGLTDGRTDGWLPEAFTQRGMSMYRCTIDTTEAYTLVE